MNIYMTWTHIGCCIAWLGVELIIISYNSSWLVENYIAYPNLLNPYKPTRRRPTVFGLRLERVHDKASLYIVNSAFHNRNTRAHYRREPGFLLFSMGKMVGLYIFFLISVLSPHACIIISLTTIVCVSL